MRQIVYTEKEEMFYKADLDLVISKLNKAKALADQIDQLIAEAASGGKHDTGCFSDDFSDDINGRFGEAQHEVSELLNSINSLMRTFKAIVAEKKAQSNE